MLLTSDWHWHSRNSCDCRHGKYPTTMGEVMAAMVAAGITDLGVTDHIHTPLNLPELEASRREFDSLPPAPWMHFGVEVSCVSAWELEQIASGGHDDATYGLREGGPAGGELAIGISEEELARFGVEYVVGGTHWPMYVPFERQAIIRDYHRQNMFLACHPLVTIVAHPWWWMGPWQDADGMYPAEPWFDDFHCIPQSMHDEFTAAVIEHGKVVEINLGPMLLTRNYPESFKQQYVEYLAQLKENGVRLSIGSDHHSQHSTTYGGVPINQPETWCDVAFGAAVTMLENVGIRDRDLWRLKRHEKAEETA
jgi:hypothetical protein